MSELERLESRNINTQHQLEVFSEITEKRLYRLECIERGKELGHGKTFFDDWLRKQKADAVREATRCFPESEERRGRLLNYADALERGEA